MEQKLNTYTKKERNLFLLGLMGQNIIYNIIGSSLSYYLQFTMLIPALAVSLIMALARVWDAFNDPIMGTIVDRTRTKYGKCRPYLIAVPGIIFVITVLCFVNFGFYGEGGTAKNVLIILWAAITYVLWGMTYTVGDIPLWGIMPMMTESEKDRNSMLSLARICGGIGGGIAMLAVQPLAFMVGDMLAPKLGNMQGERYGFLIVVIVFALIGCGLFQICGFVAKERIPPSGKRYTLKENFTIILKNKPFRQILISGILGSGKNLLQLCAMPLCTYFFAAKNALLSMLYMVILGGGMFAGMFVASGFTPKMLGKISKKKLYNFANLLGALPFVIIFIMYISLRADLVKPWAVAILFVLFVITGVSVGITMVLQSLMIADCVDYEEYHHGVRPDGLFFSGQTFLAKLTSGIATLISGICYAVVGFSDERVAEVNAFIDAGGIPREAPQYDKLMTILFFIVSIPPAISCILTVLPTWKYCLDDDVHNRILEELNQRRHKNDEAEPEVTEAKTAVADTTGTAE